MSDIWFLLLSIRNTKTNMQHDSHIVIIYTSHMNIRLSAYTIKKIQN